MAFGVKRPELIAWKKAVSSGQIAFLTHYWLDDRFPNCNTVTKVGCNDLEKLKAWGRKYHLSANWIHRDPNFPHYDLFGEKQVDILQAEEKFEQLQRFSLK